LNQSIDSTIKNLRCLLKNQSNQSINKSHLFCWELNIILYVFLLQSSSIITRSTLLDWSSSRVFISTFWLNSITWIKSSDSTQLLKLNLLIQLNYSSWIFWFNLMLISSQNSIRVLDLTRQAIEYDVKRVKYRNFSDFSPLHYLFALPFW